MSHTGTYIWDEELKQVVKISDDIPTIPKQVWFPKHGYKYFDKALQKEFGSKQEKREFLKNNGMKELPQDVSEKKRYQDCANIINEDREKRGLKPKRVSELRGDA